MRQNVRQRGIAAIWVALMMMVFAGMLGLMLDTLLARYAGQQLQIVADASALAGARLVQSDQDAARNAAIMLASLNKVAGQPLQLNFNGANAPDGDIVVGIYDLEEQTFTPDTENPNAVRVVARRTSGSSSGPLGLMFGPAFGVDSVNVSRFAIAIGNAKSSPGLVVLNSTASCAMDIASNSRVTITDSSIHINSANARALCMGSNSRITADEVNVVGGVNAPGVPNITGELNTGVSPITDPLRHLPEPPIGPPMVPPAIVLLGSQNVTIGPGYYPGGITLDSNSRLTLLPGIYILDGVGLQMNSNARISGEGVMFYIVDTTPGILPQSRLSMSSNNIVNVSPPQSGTYEGISFFQARNNTNSVLLNSNTFVIGGTLYFPSAHMSINSNAGAAGGQIIVDTIRVDSNASINVAGVGAPVSQGSSYIVQ